MPLSVDSQVGYNRAMPLISQSFGRIIVDSEQEALGMRSLFVLKKLKQLSSVRSHLREIAHLLDVVPLAFAETKHPTDRGSVPW